MGDTVGVPALRQHGNRNDTADLFPKPVFLTDRVHDFAEEFSVGDFAIIAGAGTLNPFALELLDFEARPCRGRLYRSRRRILTDYCRSGAYWAGESGSRVRRNCGAVSGGRYARRPVRRPHWAAASRISIRRQASDVEVLLQTTMKTGGVSMPARSHFSKVFFVVLVERVKSGFELVGNSERIACQFPLYRHFLADVFPKIAKNRDVGAGNVIGDGNTRQLNDPAFDGVDERKVADGPGKERTLRPA